MQHVELPPSRAMCSGRTPDPVTILNILPAELDELISNIKTSWLWTPAHIITAIIFFFESFLPKSTMQSLKKKMKINTNNLSKIKTH